MNKDLRNKNVSKRFLLEVNFLRASALICGVFLMANSALAYASPGKPTGYVNDFANVIAASDKQAIESKLSTLQNTTGVQVAVVTILSLGDETIETYAVKLFEEWGIGKEKEDNGLLIVVAPNERAARIEVGYGLEGTVTDLQSGNIISKVMIPAFKEGEYGEGIAGAVDALSAIIMNSPEAAQYSAPSNSSSSGGWSFNPIIIWFLILIIFNGGAKLLGKTKSWWLGGVIGAVLGAIIGLIAASVIVGGIAMIILMIIGLVFDYFVSKKPPGSGKSGGIWPFFLGGGRGGSGGGGFGGFGGGMSGGGGASGRW